MSLPDGIRALAAPRLVPQRRSTIRQRVRKRWMVRQLRKRHRRRAERGESIIENNRAAKNVVDSGTDSLSVGRLELPEWVGASREETEGLAAVKLLVEPALQRIPETNRNRYPDVYGDLRLLRFLRKDGIQDPSKAAARFREFLQWRVDRNIDQDIRARVELHPFVETDTRVADHLPIDFDLPLMAVDGPDDDRRLVAGYPRSQDYPQDASIVLHVGEWRTRALARILQRNELSMETFLRHWIYQNESLNRKLYLESYERKRFLYVDNICDLTACHIGQLSPGFVSNVLKPWLSTTQRYYPDTTCQVRFVNPPRVIAYGWRVVTPLVDRNTVGKVVFCPGIERQETTT